MTEALEHGAPETRHPGPTTMAASGRMARVRSRGTRGELELRRALHHAGLRYRVQYPVPGRSRRTIDIAFTRARVAVFVDGCFWHGCPLHGTQAKTNAEWWRDKIDRNRRRDVDTDEHLTALGWTVIRIWEHVDATEAATMVETSLARRLVPGSGRTAAVAGSEPGPRH